MTPVLPSGTGCQPVDLNSVDPVDLRPPFQINITTANELIAEWAIIAQSIARQCRWRPKGQCLVTCKGLAVCNLADLTLVDAQGQVVGSRF